MKTRTIRCLRLLGGTIAIAMLLWELSPAMGQAAVVARTRFNAVPACANPGSPLPSSCIDSTLGGGCSGAACVGNVEGWTFPLCGGSPTCPHPGVPTPCQSDFFTFWTNHAASPPAAPGDIATDGYARSIDAGPRNPGWMCAPNSFLGDWSQLDTVGQLCFDIRVFQTDTSRGVCTGDPSIGCAPTLCYPDGCPSGFGPCDTSVHRASPYNVTIEGLNSSGDKIRATWEGATPAGPHGWQTIEVPIVRTSGWGDTVEDLLTGIKTAGPTPSVTDWTDLLNNVTHLEIKNELFDNCAIQDERTGLDNIILGSNLIECRECLIDFEAPLAETDVIEGAFMVHPNLTITSGPPLGPPGTATIVRTDTTPTAYGAPNAPPPPTLSNNCLERNQGFTDVTSVGLNGPAHRYQFDFTPSVTEFSVRLLDFGDYNPTGSRRHRVNLIAICAPSMPVPVEAHVTAFQTTKARARSIR